MKQIDEMLYEYLLGKIPEITDDWLAMRETEEGSIYSLDAGKRMEETLREQNRMTNLTITSSLLDDPEIFEKNKQQWSSIMAESRVNSNTPVKDVLEALSNARIAYWKFVKQFFEANRNSVSCEDYIRWSETINASFDKIYVNFTSTYNEFMQAKLRSQQKLIDALSSPVIKLTDRVGVVPLVGDMDEARALMMMQTIPGKCLEADILHLYIDLSGVTTIDTLVAQQIYQIIQVLSLLGMTATLTGVRPEIAYVSTELGLDFSSTPTFGTLQQALSKAYLIENR